jgi:hypothetical protein
MPFCMLVNDGLISLRCDLCGWRSPERDTVRRAADAARDWWVVQNSGGKRHLCMRCSQRRGVVPARASQVLVPAIWKAHWESHGRAPCCCAPGCGDKIKPGCDEKCFEVTWSDGDVTYLEEGCVEWFVNGHPDYRGGHGDVPGLPS